jgi:lipopolysaccharide transport system permease protein
MRESLLELYQARWLLRQLVIKELKIRYKNSALGFVWSIVPPLLQVIIFTFVFRNVMRVEAQNYSAYLLCGLIPWTFFQTGILDSSYSILHNAALIRKVYLPREVIPLSIIISNFIHFLLAWVVYFAAYLVIFRFIGYGIPLRVEMLWFPVITVFLVLLTTGLGLFFTALNVFYEDTKFLLQSLFNLFYFLLPILYISDCIYYVDLMQRYPILYRLYMLNPITTLITAYRKSILEPLSPTLFNGQKGTNGAILPPVPLDAPAVVVACLLCVLVAWGGYAYFNKHKWEFVEAR